LKSFNESGLNEALLKGIEALGFETPTPVQQLVIPHALTHKGDIVALAQTGTGKTAAFGLPLLHLTDPTIRFVQAIVLCPTRELCMQVTSDLVNYAKFASQFKVTAVYGGTSIDQQIRAVRSGTQIVVATPGRLVDLIQREAIALDKVRHFVLDEADEMLNMGFKDELDIILSAAGNRDSMWLFSATMSEEVRSISRTYMPAPLELRIGNKNAVNENIEHVYYICRPDDKYSVLKRIVDSNPGIFGLIFCRTKADTKEIAEQMMRDGYNSEALHGDLSQNDRDRVMNRFREGTLQLLIATDVAARGIDVNDISHVINYGLPDDNEVYTHRSGRTGRAGKKGVSITITTTKFEDRIRQIERFAKAVFTKKVIPSGAEVCEQQLYNIVKGIRDIDVRHEEIDPFMPKIYEELQDLSKEDLIKRFASMEFNRFLEYYKGAMDLNIYPRNVRTRSSSSSSTGLGIKSSGSFQRVFVSIGDADGVDKREFVKLLSRDMQIPIEAIGKIDISRTYLHFDIDKEFVAPIRTGFEGMKVNGRKVRVDEAMPRNDVRADSGGGRKPVFQRADSDRSSDRPRRRFEDAGKNKKSR
jgi:ATP-dependent RNA helicase DeaD